MKQYQKGVGLVEVLVALLLLAVAVMGFIALQYRAIEATAESGARVEAISLARDLAERVRVNRTAATEYTTQLSAAANQRTFTKNCFNEACDPTELADFDVAQVVNKARTMGMTVNYLACPDTANGRSCVYVAWGETSATHGTTNGSGNCTTGTAYDPASTCLIMEVY
mgnify:FL=1